MQVIAILFLSVIILLVLLYSSVYRVGFENQPECPTLLVKSGTDILMFTDPRGDPMRFSNMDEYVNYVENQQARGIECPVLILHEEVQNEGYQTSSNVEDVIDSNDDRNPNMYNGFDPYGLQIGRYNKLDAIHDSTAKSDQSDSPMDPNWGGVQHTQDAVDSGKYDENQVTRPVYFTPKTQFFPGVYKDQADPLSYISSTGP
jgi:hypothetical protein